MEKKNDLGFENRAWDERGSVSALEDGSKGIDMTRYERMMTNAMAVLPQYMRAEQHEWNSGEHADVVLILSAVLTAVAAELEPVTPSLFLKRHPRQEADELVNRLAQNHTHMDTVSGCDVACDGRCPPGETI